MKLKDFAGKYWLWDNGLRFKVLDYLDEYGDWMAQSIDGKRTWSIRHDSMINAVELTEEQAKKEYVDISQKTIEGAFCSCCGWKVGKETMSMKIKLKQGKIPSDESARVQESMRLFFLKQRIFGVVPYVHCTEDGLELEFISTYEKEKEKKTE